MYSYALSIDPLTHKNLGPGDPFPDKCVQLGKSLRFIAARSEKHENAVEFLKEYRDSLNLMVNYIAIQEKTGDIMYFAGGGILPARTQAVEGVYPKLGHVPQSKWKGRIHNDEMPYLVNPKSGYIVSSNNHMSSADTKHAIA